MVGLLPLFGLHQLSPSHQEGWLAFLHARTGEKGWVDGGWVVSVVVGYCGVRMVGEVRWGMGVVGVVIAVIAD